MPRIVVLFCLLFCLLPLVSAQNETECPNTIDFWFDGSNATLYFINPNNTEILGTAGENVLNFIRHGFSPDCRYIGASLVRSDENTPIDCFGQFEPGRSADIFVWDSTTGQLIGEYPDNHYAHSRYSWNPYGTQLLFTACHGAILWDYANNRQLAFTDHQPLGGDLHVIWTETPAEVYGLIHGYATGYYSEGVVYSANWQSFNPLFNYDNHRPAYPNHREDCHLEYFKIEGQYLIIFCYSSWRDAAPISIWDRFNHQRLALLNAEHISTSSANLIQLSPDARYLALAGRSLRVWDLWNQSSDYEDRTANYQYSIPSYGLNTLSFIDNTTVEISYDDNITFIRMNILTGEILE